MGDSRGPRPWPGSPIPFQRCDSAKSNYHPSCAWTVAEMFAGFVVLVFYLGAFVLGALLWWPLLTYSWRYWFG